MIIDISKWQGDIDWDQLNPNQDFVIMRASCGTNADIKFAEYANHCKAPMHVYHFLMAKTTSKAEEEAEFFYNTASPKNPLSYVLDIEGEALTGGNGVDQAKAFTDKLRKMGAEKIGLYTGDWAYSNYGFTSDIADWIWIARYGKNSGEPEKEPTLPCDLWQYTSRGSIPGVNGYVDVSKLHGNKPLSYFTERNNDMKKIFTAEEYVSWLNEQVKQKRPYWYGTCFQKCTDDLLQRKTAQYPAHYTADRMERYHADIAAGQYCGDCVGGAIKGAAWTDLGQHPIKYCSNDVPDRSADGMFEYCKSLGAEHGNIKTLPEKPGVAVRMAGHVGIYVGNGKVDEWRGFKYGDVQTNLKDRGWTDWYELPWVDYGTVIIEPNTNKDIEKILGNRILKYGRSGDDVKLLQELLNNLGFDCGKADGEFGEKTRNAVRKLQAAAGIEVDGEFGPKTLAALMSLIAEKEVGDNIATEKEKVVVVTADVSANVRFGPGMNYGVITVAKHGAELPYIGIADNGWLAVDVGDKVGWISNRMAEQK